MTRYADPASCPDCRGPITPGTPACPACGLSLRGGTAQLLFGTLASADQLLARLRAETLAPAAPSGVPVGGLVAGLPQAPPTPGTLPGRPHRGLSAASVPRILLSLGALCLLVAALVFLAVTWSVLGVGGRTATLVALTAVAGVLADRLARHRLRGAAEALALVAYGLLALDVVGAEHAGWLGDLRAAELSVVVGGVLAATGAGVALAARRTPAPALTVPSVVAAVGVAFAAFGTQAAQWLPLSASNLAATLVALAATLAAHRLRLRETAVGSAVVTALCWLPLAGQAVERAVDQPGWRELWLGAEVWPLLAAAALVLVPAARPRTPIAARVAAAAVGELLLVVALLAPALRLDVTPAGLVGVAVLAVAGVATWLLPRRWSLSGLGTQLVAGAGVAFVALDLALVAARRVEDVVVAPWAGRGADRLPVAALDADRAASWLLPLAALALAGTAAVALGVLLDERARRTGAVTDLVATLLTGVLSLGVLGGLGAIALQPAPVWLLVAVPLVAAGVAVAAWAALRSPAPLAAGGGFLAVAVVLSLHAEALTAATLAVAVVLLVVVHLRSRDVVVASLAGVLLVAALAGEVWSAGAVLDARAPWTALVAIVVLAVTVLAAPYAPGRWWAAGPPQVVRTGAETAAAAAALLLGVAGAELAPVDQAATWVAVYLTLAGAAVTTMSLLREDRRSLSWAGGALLALASWVRLWDLGVSTPEAYTLPTAAVLLGVGLLHLRRDGTAGTVAALSPALGLALVPSLLWSLEDPTGLRPLLLGLACAGLVLFGVARRWTAPLVLGATVGGLLVLRLAAPYVGDAVPRWVLIGLAGALLLAVGATWEHRLADMRHVAGYVRRLR